ncbi:MAG TPA: hypothetical protein VME68_08005 [Acidobacteriaceae bacterium]|nr:hypothetical protein [Acidobacteriaceae bacterium]
MATNPIFPNTRTALQTLENQLAAANPVGAQASQAVADALDATATLLTALNQEEAAQLSGQMIAAGQDVKDAVQKLTNLKKQLAQIASDIGILGDIADGLDTALSGCKTVFGI